MSALQHTAAPVRAFLDWPVVTDPADWSGDVALIGIQHSEPYADDPWPNDQSRAPDALRRASPGFSDGAEHWDFDLGGARSELGPLRCIDVGNLAWNGKDFDAYAAAASARLRQLWRMGMQVFVVGGDHGVTIPALDALDGVGAPVYLLHVDAHLDWREEVGGVRRGYSSPLRWASRMPWICGMTQIGLRATGSARAGELEAARAYGSRLFTAEQIHAEGLEPVLATIPEGVALYVTVDADGLDPTEMPAVMGPAPGGLYFRQLAPLLRALALRQRVVGFDMVEIAPRLDHANAITCITAGRLILNLLGASWAAAGPWRSQASKICRGVSVNPILGV